MRRVRAKINHTKKLFITSLASVLIGSSLALVPAASALTIGGPSDCDNNAIVNCGVHSTAAIMNAYQSSAYVRGVYAAFGISNADIANLQADNVSGYVTKDGNVFIDGQSKAVATNAITGGRQNIAGSTMVNAQGAVFYKRPPSVSFQQASLPAFISMKNGVFQFAIIASCGNPVKASAVKQPQVGLGNAQVVSKPQAKPAPKPAPTPAAPTQVQAQSQSQVVNVTNTNKTVVNNTTQPAATQPAPVISTTSTQPTSLVNTGTSGVIGIFVAASAVGTFAFRRFLSYRLSSNIN